MAESASPEMENYFYRRDEAANEARKNCLWNMFAAVMAMMVILCVIKSVCELINLSDQWWIRFFNGIAVFLCAVVIIHLFCERQRIKTEPLANTQDMENAHCDSEEIMSVIKQTRALKNHHTFWTALLTSIITSCFWILTAILFYKADSKKDINYAWSILFSLLIPTSVYFKDIFFPMIICPLLEFLDPIPAS